MTRKEERIDELLKGCNSLRIFWSSTELSNSNAWNRLLCYNISEVYRGINYKHYGLSIRGLLD